MRPHSKLGDVPNTSQPGGRARSAPTAPTAMAASRMPNQIRRPVGIERTSWSTAEEAARGPTGTVRPARVRVRPGACIAQASLTEGPR